MAKGELKIDERRKQIIELLRRDGQVRVSELSRIFGATAVTIRNDLNCLEQDGFLERTQGGAIQTVKNFYNLDFLNRKQTRMAEKKRIAIAAAAMISDGDTLMLNSGTTTYFTAVELKKHKNLNIVTNSVAVAIELGDVPTFRVILLGGEFNAQYSFSYGEDARRQLAGYKADYALLSMDGLSPQAGVTTYHAEESTIDLLMMDRARKTLLVADSSKLGRESFSRVCGLDRIDTWVTDEGADPALLKAVCDQGLEVAFLNHVNPTLGSI